MARRTSIMGGPLGNYPVAPLVYLSTAFAVLCSVSVLIPTALAQDLQPTTLYFHPPKQSSSLPDTQDGTWWQSYVSSNDQSAQFVVDSNVWDTIEVSAALWCGSYRGRAALFKGDQLVFGSNQSSWTYQIPEESNNYTIKARSNIPDLCIFVYVRGARSSTTQIGQTTPGATSPVSQTSPTQTVTSSTSTVSSLSITSTTQLTSHLTIPTTASPTIPTGLLSPPAFTNPPTSISDASLVSSSSDTPGPNSAAIVGAVFGVFVGIALCIFAALLYRRRRVRNRVAPSTSFMNYRSTTEQPPAYHFHRTSFFQRSKAGLTGSGVLGDRKVPPPYSFSTGVAGLGYGAGAGGRRLMTLDEKSAEGRDSPIASSGIAPSYEDPHGLAIPYQGPGGMGVGDIAGGSLAVAGAGAHGPAAPRGLSIDVARTLTPPTSTTPDKLGSAPSFLDQNPYDGITVPEPSHADPFRTPPADDNNLASRGAWGT